MSKKKTISADFSVNDKMVDEFARLTGDYNSMHVDPEVARKSKYRRTVVHGMIPYSFLQILQLEYPEQHLLFENFSTRFRSPVFVGDDIHLDISHEFRDGVGTFEAKWLAKNSDTVLITSNGGFRLTENGENSEVGSGGGSDTFIIGRVDENQFFISDLSDQRESFKITIDSAAKQMYCDSVLNVGLAGQFKLDQLCNNLASILTLSSCQSRFHHHYQ